MGWWGCGKVGRGKRRWGEERGEGGEVGWSKGGEREGGDGGRRKGEGKTQRGRKGMARTQTLIKEDLNTFRGTSYNSRWEISRAGLRLYCPAWSVLPCGVGLFFWGKRWEEWGSGESQASQQLPMCDWAKSATWGFADQLMTSSEI